MLIAKPLSSEKMTNSFLRLVRSATREASGMVKIKTKAASVIAARTVLRGILDTFARYVSGNIVHKS